MIVIDTNNLNDSYKCKLNPTIDIYFLQKNTIFNKQNEPIKMSEAYLYPSIGQ